MKIPSPNTQAYQTYLAEMEVVFDSIKAVEVHGGDMTYYFDRKKIPTAKRAAQEADETKLEELYATYHRLAKEFCAKYEFTEDERENTFYTS